MSAPPFRCARLGAQAKVNLFLRVLAREESGYHQIETLLCRLALADLVTVRVTEGPRSLDVAGAAMPEAGLGPVEENLAWRAAIAFAEHAEWAGGFAIEIDKRIPVGGGLGGGSSDAGAVLNAMNALAARPLSWDSLLEVAASLGADVPFLTSAQPLALAWGRGGNMLALPPLPSRPVLLVTFPFGVPTSEAYSWIAASRADAIAPARLLDPEKLTSWTGLVALAANDFEHVVPARFPAIDAVLRALRSERSIAQLGNEAIVLLSGSGATVMAIGDPGWRPETAERVLEGIEGVSLIATSTASRVEEVQLFE